MENKLRKAPGPNFVFYSAHDGLLLAMLAALQLDIQDGKYFILFYL
jgi:hypothetical protein